MFRKRTSHDSTSGLMLKAALDYGRLGWSFIPITPRGKRPLIPWEEYQHRRPAPTEAVDWYRRWPNANIAVVTGAVSGLVVLDLDPEHGADASLARLEEVHGPLVKTVEVRTGGGGRHFYFAHPGDVIRNRIGLAPGIDLRGDGGYVVAPPSIHACGAIYRWERSATFCLLESLPEWLRGSHEHQDKHGHPLSHWRRLLRDGVTEGQRNTTIASLAGHLLNHHVDPEVTMELLLSWNITGCRPPLEPEEVARTVDSITRIHQREQDK